MRVEELDGASGDGETFGRAEGGVGRPAPGGGQRSTASAGAGGRGRETRARQRGGSAGASPSRGRSDGKLLPMASPARTPAFRPEALAVPGLTLELAELADNVGQGAAIDKLHRVVMHAALAAHGMDRHDIRVMQERRRLGLGFEPLKLARVEAAANGRTFRATRRRSESCSAS